MRLNKYIAHAGIASRRKADELTINGNVKINGLTMREPGYNVKPGDVVEVNGQRISGQEKMEYVLLNKPKGYITSMQDEKGRPVVTELVADVDARLFPVGRLDYNTSGMLILTNDGDLTYRLTHPRHQVTKTYRALVSGVLSKEKLFRLRKGVDIGGFVTSPAQGKKQAGKKNVRRSRQSGSGAAENSHWRSAPGQAQRRPLPKADKERN